MLKFGGLLCVDRVANRAGQARKTVRRAPRSPPPPAALLSFGAVPVLVFVPAAGRFFVGWPDPTSHARRRTEQNLVMHGDTLLGLVRGLPHFRPFARGCPFSHTARRGPPSEA